MSMDVTNYTQRLRTEAAKHREELDEANKGHREKLAGQEVQEENKLRAVKKSYQEERLEDASDFNERVNISNQNFKERYDKLKASMLNQLRDVVRQNEKERTHIRTTNERQLASITKSYEEVVQMKNREIEELKSAHETQLRHINKRNEKRVATLVDNFTESMETASERQREEIERFQKLS